MYVVLPCHSQITLDSQPQGMLGNSYNISISFKESLSSLSSPELSYLIVRRLPEGRDLVVGL
jgi:hypothetical protein